MKKLFLLFLPFVLAVSVATAQFSVVSTVPANNTKNVPLNTTISITFSEAIDTVAYNNTGDYTWFSNVSGDVISTFSQDLKTINVNVSLQPNTPYFVAFIHMKAKSGSAITTPYVFYFTTGAEFPPYSVSGTIHPGSTGVNPDGAIVGLASKDIFNSGDDDGPPPFVGWANVNSNGTYTIPFIANGTYWPITAKDVDHDGNIDPEGGMDVLGVHDSIIVNGASLTNIDMTFIKFSPMLLSEAFSTADSLANTLPADKVLRRISGYDVDTLGRSRSWGFVYTINNNSEGREIKVRQTESGIDVIDQGYFEWIKTLKPITNFHNAASTAALIANVENAGGKMFRIQPHADTLEFRIEITISDQKNGWFDGEVFDTSKIYYAVAYALSYQIDPNQSMWVDGRYFLCDLATGAVLLSKTVDVKENGIAPLGYFLSQNYPNPFNPATTIHYTLPASGFTTMRVFDLLGKEVAVLVNEKKDAGDYTVRFDASTLPSGIYFYQLRSGNYFETKKMVLMK